MGHEFIRRIPPKGRSFDESDRRKAEDVEADDEPGLSSCSQKTSTYSVERQNKSTDRRLEIGTAEDVNYGLQNL